MSRFAFRATLVALSFSIAAAVPAPTASADEPDVGALIDEMIENMANDARRDALFVRIAAYDPAEMTPHMIRWIGKEEVRDYTVRVSTALRVPGLQATVIPLIDGKAEASIVNLLVAVPNKEGLDLVFSRWESINAVTEADRFKSYDTAFRTYYIDPAEADRFKPHLAAKPATLRTPLAAAIVKFQLEMDTDDPAKVLKDLKKAQKRLDGFAKTIRVKGTDLTGHPAWRTGLIRRLGSNFRLGDGGVATLAVIPSFVEKSSYNVRASVYVSAESSEVSFSINTDQGMWAPKTRGTEWVISTGSATEYVAPLKVNAWNTLDFAVKVANGRGKLAFDIDIEINGKNILRHGEFNGGLKVLAFSAKKGTAVVAGVGIEKD
jgi:hypothetical protein